MATKTKATSSSGARSRTSNRIIGMDHLFARGWAVGRGAVSPTLANAVLEKRWHYANAGNDLWCYRVRICTTGPLSRGRSEDTAAYDRRRLGRRRRTDAANVRLVYFLGSSNPWLFTCNCPRKGDNPHFLCMKFWRD
jgi:hypothetical protein